MSNCKILTDNDLDKIVDRNGLHLDIKIRPLVAAVNLYNSTTASCEGHDDRANPFPWVELRDEKGDFSEIIERLKEWNAGREVKWHLVSIGAGLYGHIQKELKPALSEKYLLKFKNYTKWNESSEYCKKHHISYSPLDVAPEELLRDCRLDISLTELQEEINSLADFLKSRSILESLL